MPSDHSSDWAGTGTLQASIEPCQVMDTKVSFESVRNCWDEDVLPDVPRLRENESQSTVQMKIRYEISTNFILKRR